MRYSTWIGLMAAALLIVSCFTPWVVIESRNITISGIDAAGTNYGKPGYFHIVFAGLYIIFSLIPRLWAKRANLPVVGFNTAWVIRNFFSLAICTGGECPTRKFGLWMMLLASLLMLITALFPDVKRKSPNKA
jgi:hypothetical protein